MSGFVVVTTILFAVGAIADLVRLTDREDWPVPSRRETALALIVNTGLTVWGFLQWA